MAQLLQDAHRKERRLSRGSKGRGRAVNGNKKENCNQRHPRGWRFFVPYPMPTRVGQKFASERERFERFLGKGQVRY
jgi:hypothetical protein